MNDPSRDPVPAGYGAPNGQPATTELPPVPTGTSAGKGGLAILGAKVFFILTGLVQQPLLVHVLGLGEYGAFSRILAPSNILNNVTVSASIQGASRTVAGAQDGAGAVLRRLMRIHVVLAVALFLLLAVAAPGIAWFQGAPHIVPGLLAMACVLGVYAVYAPLVGSLNGRRLFVRQAGLDVLAATLRTTGLIALGYLFVRSGMRGATGSALGALFAVSCIFPVALIVSQVLKKPAVDAQLDHKAYLKGIAGLALAQFFTNLLMQVDIMALGHFLSTGGDLGAMHTKQADEWVGVYRSCQLFAFLPYQLLFAVTQVLFPLLAKAHAEGDHEGVKHLVARGLRVGLVVTGLLVSVVVAMPRSLLRLVYPEQVAEHGHHTLHLLALGQGLFAVLGLCTTVLASLGKERRAAAITGVATLLVATLGFVLVPHAEFGEAQLQRMATATTAGLALALVLGALAVVRLAKAFAPAKTLVRVGLAVGLAFALGTVEPRVGKLVTLIMPVGIVLAYVVILLITGEMSPSDLAALRSVVRRKK